MEFRRPRTLAEAVHLGQELGFDAKYVAGGTAVVLMLQQGLIAPTVLIDLRSLEDVPGMQSVERRGDVVRIGVGVTLAQVASSPAIVRDLPDLARAAAVVGNVRVRNAATLCGNAAEADHSSDPPAVLVNRGAAVVIAGPAGERREPMADFLRDFFTTSLEEGDIVVGLEIPAPARVTSSYRKFRSRSSEDRPCVSVAAAATLEDRQVQSLAVTVGATTPCPVRLDDVTSAVRGRRLDEVAEDVAAAYRERIDPVADARGSSWFRSQIIAVEVRRALLDLAADEEDRVA